MEDWSFPPRFDPEYLPPAQSRYWFPKRETMPAAERDAAILGRLQQLTRYAWDTSPFYRRHWDEAGFHPDHLRSLEDFEAKVPVVTKKHLREAQSRVPPFGDYLCIPERDVHHIHGTSGTTGRPTAFAIGRGDWDAIANAHARIMWGMGIRPGDVVFVSAIFSLYMGSWGALSGAERLHAKAFPFGAGAPGMTARAAMWLDLTKPAALYATPSFALHLAEVARAEGYDPRGFGLKTMFFSGEPGASVPGVRDRIVAAFGARGTPVYTHLERTSQPMIRLASGDLTLWEDGPAPCGRTYPRLPQGIFGRIDDMFTIRGENVYPSEVDAVLNQLPGYGGEHRIVITREGAMDELLIRVEIAAGDDARGSDARTVLRDEAARRMQKMLGLRSKIEIVAPGTFPRTDFKARRVVDDREVFREMNARVGTGSSHGAN